MKQRDHGLELALRAAGSLTALAHGLGITTQSVFKWRKVPAERCPDVERLTGVPRETLRPDIYGPPRASRGNVAHVAA